MLIEVFRLQKNRPRQKLPICSVQGIRHFNISQKDAFGRITNHGEKNIDAIVTDVNICMSQTFA
jgi:hypothetical protein